jgi:hypothetical protein
MQLPSALLAIWENMRQLAQLFASRVKLAKLTLMLVQLHHAFSARTADMQQQEPTG